MEVMVLFLVRPSARARAPSFPIPLSGKGKTKVWLAKQGGRKRQQATKLHRLTVVRVLFRLRDSAKLDRPADWHMLTGLCVARVPFLVSRGNGKQKKKKKKKKEKADVPAPAPAAWNSWPGSSSGGLLIS